MKNKYMTNCIQNDIRYLIYCADYQSLFPSLKEQSERLIQKAEFEELNIVGIYADKPNQNKTFQTILRLINQNKAQGILIWDTSMLPQSLLLNSMVDTNKIKSIKSYISD
jgi:hypothetical protein